MIAADTTVKAYRPAMGDRPIMDTSVNAARATTAKIIPTNMQNAKISWSA